MKRIGRWLVLAALLAGGAYGVVRWRAAHGEPEVQYRTAAIEKRRIVARVTASGTLQATVTVLVGTQVSGRVKAIFVDFNSPVKKGQVVAKIDPQLFQAAVASANANYLSAKANLTKSDAQVLDAARQFERVKKLSAEGLASTTELNTAETNLAVARASVDVARATIEQARAALNQAQVNMSYTDIVSPIDGTVISRAVDVGQTVAASLQTPTLFTIAEDLRKMQVNANVSESDVGRLAQGMDATFTVDAFPGQRFAGKIAQIRNAAQTVQNVVTYDAVVDVPNPDLKLRPGMTANVTFVYAEKEDAVAVPNAALRFRPPSSPAGSASARESRNGGGRRFQRPDGGTGEDATSRPIYRLEGAAPQTVVVRTGLTDGTFTELVGAELRPGDLVIVDTVGGAASSAAPAGGRPMGRMF